MELLVVAAVCGLSFLASALLWHVWVAPELVLSLLDDGHAGAERSPERRAVRWLRLLLSVVVLLVGFVTGAVLAFLAET